MGLSNPWRRFASDERGVAAIETALIGTLLIGAMLNVVEVGRYAYIATQVTSASQAGAYAVIAGCSAKETPVTTACPEAADAIAAAIAGTSLGDKVTLDGDVQEGWQCVNAEGLLEQIAGADDPKPVNCADAGAPANSPGLYVRVRVAYAFDPIFPGLTITEGFDDHIVRSAWMRVR